MCKLPLQSLEVLVIYAFIYLVCIKLIRSDREDIYSIIKDLYFKWTLFFLTFYSSVNPEK